MNDSITITGNIATEPQHKRTAAGVPITTFRVASGQRRYDRASDAWVDSETNFYSVSAFRGLAEHAFQSLRRGERVILNGRLRVRNWDSGTKSGTDVEIEADAIGHDLMWGTTTFVKAARAASAPSGDAAAADTWVAPGTPAGDATDAPATDPTWGTPGAEVGPREPADMETPF
jgi:single-strand DNA-binding protein